MHLRAHRTEERSTRRLLALSALFLAALVAALWAGIALLGALPGDAASAAKVREERLGWLVLAPAHGLDWLGQPAQGACLGAALAAWIWTWAGWRHAVLLIAAFGVSGVTWLLKEAVDRPRPGGGGVHDPSFPSGHTALAVAVLGVVIVCAVERRRWLVALVSLGLIAAMGLSRVLLGVHWASDVLAGYAVGALWLIGVLLLAGSWAKRDSSRRSATSVPADQGDQRHRSHDSGNGQSDGAPPPGELP